MTPSPATVEGLREFKAAKQRQSFLAELNVERKRRRNGNGPTEPSTSWAPVDLAAVLRDGCLDEPPQMLARTDGRCLIYAGKNHVFSGEPEAGKGWAALYAAAERVRAGEHALSVDFEDVATTFAGRMLALGLDEETIAERFHYVQPSEPLEGAGWSDLQRALTAEPTIAILDGVTEALVLHGLELKDNSDVAKWLALLPRKLTAAGIAVIQIDHVGRDRETRGRYALGAQHKQAGIDAHYGFDVIEPFGRGLEGRVRIMLSKDRYGHVRPHADESKRIAELRLTSHPNERVEIALEPPSTESASTFRPTGLMKQVSRAIEDAPGLTKNGIRSAVGGKQDYKDLALELLVAEGYVEARRDGQAHRHYSIHPYRDDEEA